MKKNKKRATARTRISSASQHDRDAVIRTCEARLPQAREGAGISGRDRGFPGLTITRVDLLPRGFGPEVDERAVKGREMDMPPKFLAFRLRDPREAEERAVVDEVSGCADADPAPSRRFRPAAIRTSVHRSCGSACPGRRRPSRAGTPSARRPAARARNSPPSRSPSGGGRNVEAAFGKLRENATGFLAHR